MVLELKKIRIEKEKLSIKKEEFCTTKYVLKICIKLIFLNIVL